MPERINIEMIIVIMVGTTALLAVVAVVVCCKCCWKKSQGQNRGQGRNQGGSSSGSSSGYRRGAVRPIDRWMAFFGPRKKTSKKKKSKTHLKTISEDVEQGQQLDLGDTVDTNKEFQNCPVCLDQFTFKNKLPKMLSCQHTFCKHCVRRLVKTTTMEGEVTASIACPECRGTQAVIWTPGPWDAADQLPNNITMLRYMEQHKREETESIT